MSRVLAGPKRTPDGSFVRFRPFNGQRVGTGGPDAKGNAPAISKIRTARIECDYNRHRPDGTAG